MRWKSASALVVAFGAAALQTAIVGRDAQGAVDFIVIGATPARMIAAGAVAAAAMLAVHVVLLRVVRRFGGDPGAIRSGVYLRPLLAFAAPIAGVAAAMWGGRMAPALVYWSWELSPWWLMAAVIATVTGALSASGAIRWPAVQAAAEDLPARVWAPLLAVAVVAWILASNLSLRTWFAPHGDEARYLRHAESWYQGQGADISRVVPITELPRDAPPRVHHSVARAGRALVDDARRFAADVKARLTQPGFVWNRASGGDGSFVVGRDGGVYQSHQPGLGVLLLPAYVIDRRLSRGTVYRGQFPDRFHAVYATLLIISALGAIALTTVCRRAGSGLAIALVLGALAWMALPMSALALQIYPETAASLAILAALAMMSSWRGLETPPSTPVPTTILPASRQGLKTPSPRPRAAVAIGMVAAFPLLLHVRFLAVVAVLAAFGVWTLRRSRRLVAAFVAGALIPASLQVWYVYHATGLPVPGGFYDASEGAWINPLAVPVNMLRFAVDRDWGVLPHAPLLMLAVAGLVPLWRTRRDVAIAVVLLAGGLMATGAANSVTAAGGTPDRLIAAIVPVLLVPIAAAVREWAARPLFQVVFVLLAVLSLDQAWDYNRAHLKGVGLFVTAGASGWRVNRLFPYLSDGVTPASVPALATAAAAVALLTAALVWGRRAASWSRLRAAAAVSVVLLLMMTTAGAWDGSHPRYRYGDEPARAALVNAYVRNGTCAMCWSSRRGPIGAGDLAPNRLDALTLDAEPGASSRVRYRLTATGPDGPVFGTVRLEFGDGDISPPQVMAGRLEVAHEYRGAGDVQVKAWLERPGQERQTASTRVHVR